MIQTLFIEKDIQNHSHVLKVQSDFPKARNIYIENYGEVFNRKGQSFRLQKKQPGLILAKKYGRCVLPSPEGFGIGGKNSLRQQPLNKRWPQSMTIGSIIVS